MRKGIYIVMRTNSFGSMPVAAFTSADEARKYGKEKEAKDKNYRWHISNIWLEDKEQE